MREHITGFASAHFLNVELSCPCCGLLNIDSALLEGLESFRTIIDRAVIVNDACRCEMHNKSVGGVPHSEHPQGKAADITALGMTLQELFDAALKVPAFKNGGIGVYDTVRPMIHVDVRGVKARWARIKGVYKSASLLVSLANDV